MCRFKKRPVMLFGNRLGDICHFLCRDSFVLADADLEFVGAVASHQRTPLIQA
jgi:hypothetical protein